MRTPMLAIMLCAGTIIAGYAAEAESVKNIKTFPAKGIADINIRTNSALIYLETAQTADIQVEQLPDNARACNITMKIAGKQLILKATDKSGEYKDIKTGFRVQLPAGISVTARSNSGDIEIHRITAPVEARTNSGDIKLDNVSGSLKATTDSGDIEGAINSPEKPISLKTLSGDVSVTFPENAAIAVNAGTSSGTLHNDFSGKTGLPVSVRATSGDTPAIPRSVSKAFPRGHVKPPPH